MEGKKFKCDICQSSFTSKFSLKEHIESIDEGKVFECDIFPSIFTPKVNMKDTLIQFMEEEHSKFKCDIALLNFTQKGRLKTHIESVHRGKTILK